jgi:hypothetical protein
MLIYLISELTKLTRFSKFKNIFKPEHIYYGGKSKLNLKLLSGFKFGFSIPTSCDSKTEIDNKMTVKSDIDGTDMCQGHDIVTCHSEDIKCEGSDIITTFTEAIMVTYESFAFFNDFL